MTRKLTAVALATALSIGASAALADEDGSARIGEIEKMLQNLQRQREEQDSQIRELKGKLAEMQQQMAQPKADQPVAVKGGGENRSAGNAVYGGSP